MQTTVVNSLTGLYRRRKGRTILGKTNYPVLTLLSVTTRPEARLKPMLTATILTVDDHALFRSGLRLVLRADLPDSTIIETSSIHQTLHTVETTPDIILLDIELDGLNGLEGIALLKRKWPHAPIIMLSSDASSSTLQTAMARGASAFVTKADTANTILSAIQQALTKNNSEIQIISPASELSGARLTARQYEVLDLLNKGMSNKVIARELACTENTVRGHVQAILLFFQVASRSEAVYAAKQQGIIH